MWGHVHVIEWALESGAEWNDAIPRAAAINNRINVLDRAYRKRYPFSKEDTFFYGSSNMIAWCRKCFEVRE